MPQTRKCASPGKVSLQDDSLCLPAGDCESESERIIEESFLQRSVFSYFFLKDPEFVLYRAHKVQFAYED